MNNTLPYLSKASCKVERLYLYGSKQTLSSFINLSRQVHCSTKHYKIIFIFSNVCST